MTIKEKIYEICGDDEVLLADGFDSALIGFGRVFAGRPIAVYDKAKVLGILKKQGMKMEEAIEYFEYNIEGSYVGEATPMFLERIK